MHQNTRACAGAVAATLFILVGLSVGCDKSSPSAPTTSASPPPSVAMSVTEVSPTTGPTSFVSDIRVTGTGFLSGATVTLDGLAATTFVVSSTLISARAPIHAPGTTDVTVTNPGGQSARLPAAYSFEVPSASLTATPSVVASGGELTLTWNGPNGRSCIGGGDWIALFRAGAPDITGAANGHSDIWFVHVCGATSGLSRLSAPAQSGEYEFRFMIGDTSIARSNRVTVR